MRTRRANTAGIVTSYNAQHFYPIAQSQLYSALALAEDVLSLSL